MILDILSSLFILLFLYTGASKFYESEYFRISLRDSPLGKYSAFLAIPIPAAELLIALMLLFPLLGYYVRLRKWGLISFAVLMAAFTIYVGLMLLLVPHSQLPCACGGIIGQLNWRKHLYVNSIFTCLALYSIWLDRKVSSSSSNLSFNLPQHG